MNLPVRIGAITIAAIMLAASAHAQEGPPPACSTGSPALPTALASWPHRTALPSGSKASALADAHLAIGRAIDAGLHPTPRVDYALRPEKPGGTVSFGGLYAFTVARAGTYRVALGSAAWIDVVRGGHAALSTAHGHGPACSGIMKMVDFALTPGDYVLQISANASDKLPLLVTRLP